MGEFITRLRFGLIGIICTFCFLMFSWLFMDKIICAAILADHGVSISGTVLERTRKNTFIIGYDKYKGAIYFTSHFYPTNSTIPLVYDKNHPKVFLIGRSNMGFWDLLKLNSDWGDVGALLMLFGMGSGMFISFRTLIKGTQSSKKRTEFLKTGTEIQLTKEFCSICGAALVGAKRNDGTKFLICPNYKRADHKIYRESLYFKK